MIALYALAKDGRRALLELPPFERFFHAFWLLGPFFMLIERTPGDVYILTIALAFVFRSLKTKNGTWLNFFWVKAAFVFWIVCLVSAAASPNALYALGEAFVWFRFPLFGMACVFWLGRDQRLLYLMLASTALALLSMCGILSAEIITEGFKSRLMWPYGDMVPGNFLTKVGLPIIVFLTALTLSYKGQKAVFMYGFCLLVICMTILTGERINSLILFCASILTVFVCETNWKRRSLLICLICSIPAFLFLAFPEYLHRYVVSFFDQIPVHKESAYYQTMMPAFLIFGEYPVLGIGPGNFRYLCSELIRPDAGLVCFNHPHNFYLQILAETGILGFLTGITFILSLFWFCFCAGKSRQNLICAVAWIVPFALFWPIRSSADFFGQWNNVFLWTGLSLALAVSQLKSTIKT